MNPYALVAFYFLFAIVILVSNIILAAIVISRGLAKQRSFLLLLNFTAADVIYAICLFVQTLGLLVPVYSSQLGLTALSAISSLLPSVVQTTLVLVNVSYVLETRKEHARLNGSRLLAAVMVASPWLYALLVVTPFAVSTLDSLQSLTGVTYASSTYAIGLLLVSHVYPGLFACIATTLAVVSYATRDRQEGNALATSRGDITPMHNLASTQRGSNSNQPQGVTSAARAPPGTAGDVTEEPRSPKAEVVYTAVSVGLLQLTIYILMCAAFGSYVLAGSVLQNGLLAAAFITLLRPAFFCWLWLLRPDLKKGATCCGRRSSARYH